MNANALPENEWKRPIDGKLLKAMPEADEIIFKRLIKREALVIYAFCDPKKWVAFAGKWKEDAE